MKILMINDVGTLHAGAEVLITQLRQALVKRGHQVRTLAGSEPSNGPVIADYRYTSFADGSPLQAFLYLFNPFAMMRLMYVLRTFRPDVVHLQQLMIASNHYVRNLKSYFRL